MIVSFALLAASIVFCIWLIANRRGEGIGLPIIAIGAFTFLYLAQPLYLLANDVLPIYVSDTQIAKGLLWPAIDLVTFVWIWTRTSRVRMKRRPLVLSEWRRFWLAGLLAALVGTSLFGVFIARSGGAYQVLSSAHGAGAAWEDNTAYLYMSPWWMVCGIAMMTTVGWRTRCPAYCRVLPAVFACIFFGLYILLSSRGMIFACATASFVTFTIARKDIGIKPANAAPVFALISLAVLLVLGFRAVLHLGEIKQEVPTVTEALGAAMASDDNHTSQRVSGIEFIYHCLSIDTIDATQKYDLALNWVYAYTIHPIPRLLWPEKPYNFDFLGVSLDDIYSISGVTIAGGAARGFVADLYSQFGVFSVVFVALISRASKHLFLSAVYTTSPIAPTLYAMVCALSLHMFAQGFGAILVPLPFSVLPLIGFRLYETFRNKQRPAKSRPRRLQECSVTWFPI